MSESSAQPEALVIDDAEVSEFINSVEFAPVSDEQACVLTATALAFVNGGFIEYLPIPEQQKTDYVLWTLFGQLVADSKVKRFKDPGAWNKEYFETLHKLGVTPGLSKEKISIVVGGGSVDGLVLQDLKPFLSHGGQIELKKIINALRDKTNKKALDQFNSASSDSSSANFQVSDGTVDKNLTLTFHVGSMNFKTKEHITDLLFWHFHEILTINYSSHVLYLSKNTADKLRKQVYARVFPYIVGNVIPINLA